MLSEPPMPRLWQELQEMAPDLDRRGSKNNFLPSSTLAGSLITAASIGCIGSCAAVVAVAGLAHSPASSPAASHTLCLLMSLTPVE